MSPAGLFQLSTHSKGTTPMRKEHDASLALECLKLANETSNTLSFWPAQVLETAREYFRFVTGTEPLAPVEPFTPEQVAEIRAIAGGVFSKEIDWQGLWMGDPDYMARLKASRPDLKDADAYAKKMRIEISAREEAIARARLEDDQPSPPNPSEQPAGEAGD